ncbi:hypothetical protein NADFUDRAFT_83390 [Nadsonia fulvescens var. elongata DSM 6958]|uniref:PH domain-containing protein n=1 Tax=Nadsonia fulvescens var. elongata DSM 6958 TaxID=857566 RepID=A0A1E3PKC9_9ASCO|nr:hypothetical protein NADFUDRAFT_83390 [Nadsonia fulvescens var. elongata DSM 6958]
MSRLRAFSRSKVDNEAASSNGSTGPSSLQSPNKRISSGSGTSIGFYSSQNGNSSSSSLGGLSSTGSLFDFPAETSPELIPVLTLLIAQQKRQYLEGYFMLLNDLKPDGKPATDRKWVEVFGRLNGTVLSIWDADVLDRSLANLNSTTEPTPNYINITDSSFKSINVLPSPNGDLNNVIVLSTTLKNRYLLQFASSKLIQQWTAGFRLSIYEYNALQEAYTGAILSAKGAKLNGIRTLLAETKFKHQDWVSVRFGAGMPWKKCWTVISPYEGKQRKNKPVKLGNIMFFENEKKSKTSKNTLATVTMAYSAFAVYPASASLIDHSTLIKIEGKVKFSDKDTKDEKDASVFLMPEQHPGIIGFETLIRAIIPIYDVFNLYGRPQRLNADKADLRSLLFAMPSLPKLFYLDLVDVLMLAAVPGSDNWSAQDWSRNIKELLARKYATGYKGCGSIKQFSQKIAMGSTSILSSPNLSQGGAASTGEFEFTNANNTPKTISNKGLNNNDMNSNFQLKDRSVSSPIAYKDTQNQSMTIQNPPLPSIPGGNGNDSKKVYPQPNRKAPKPPVHNIPLHQQKSRAYVENEFSSSDPMLNGPIVRTPGHPSSAIYLKGAESRVGHSRSASEGDNPNTLLASIGKPSDPHSPLLMGGNNDKSFEFENNDSSNNDYEGDRESNLSPKKNRRDMRQSIFGPNEPVDDIDNIAARNNLSNNQFELDAFGLNELDNLNLKENENHNQDRRPLGQGQFQKPSQQEQQQYYQSQGNLKEQGQGQLRYSQGPSQGQFQEQGQGQLQNYGQQPQQTRSSGGQSQGPSQRQLQTQGQPQQQQRVPQGPPQYQLQGQQRSQPRMPSGGMPQGLRSGIPQGMPQGMPQGIPQGIPQGTLRGQQSHGQPQQRPSQGVPHTHQSHTTQEILQGSQKHRQGIPPGIQVPQSGQRIPSQPQQRSIQNQSQGQESISQQQARSYDQQSLQQRRHGPAPTNIEIPVDSFGHQKVRSMLSPSTPPVSSPTSVYESTQSRQTRNISPGPAMSNGYRSTSPGPRHSQSQQKQYMTPPLLASGPRKNNQIPSVASMTRPVIPQLRSSDDTLQQTLQYGQRQGQSPSKMPYPVSPDLNNPVHDRNRPFAEERNQHGHQEPLVGQPQGYASGQQTYLQQKQQQKQGPPQGQPIYTRTNYPEVTSGHPY